MYPFSTTTSMLRNNTLVSIHPTRVTLLARACSKRVGLREAGGGGEASSVEDHNFLIPPLYSTVSAQVLCLCRVTCNNSTPITCYLGQISIPLHHSMAYSEYHMTVVFVEN